MPASQWKIGRSPLIAYLAATLGILVVVFAFHPFHKHLRTTPGLFFILVIVLVARRWGEKPALFASLLAVVSINYFFLPPFHSLHTQEVRYLLMSAAFAITAVTVGQLSARAQRRTQDAVKAKLEAERLYRELEDSFERASQAEALRRTAEHLKLAETVANTGSFDLQLPGSIRLETDFPDFWSESLYEVLGIDRSVQPGFDNWLAAIHPDDYNRTRDAIAEFVHSREEHMEVDYRRCAPDGQIRWINTRCRLIRNAEGGAVRLVGAAIDLTDRQRAAEAIRSSEQFKSALLDCLTHDLGTPLTSVRLEVATLLRDKALKAMLSKNQREALTTIREEVDRLHKFIANLIAMARISAGELRLRTSVVEVEAVFAEARERIRPLCGPSRVQWNISPDLPSIAVDSSAVCQAIHAIVENACKYGSPHTPILITATQSGDGVVSFAIENSGPVIPTELRERVFDRFYRIEEAMHAREQRSALASGNGMGLAIARGMIEANGGRIWIEEVESSSGTRVAFTLPVHRAAACACDFSI